MKKYSHLCTIAFTVDSDYEGEDIPIRELITALFRRLADVEENLEWRLAIEFLETSKN
jgi:hypothetical protein